MKSDIKTFEELRTKYIEKNPNSAFENIIPEKNLTKQTLIDLLKENGIDIKPRTISYYISEGIIESPKIGPKKIGRGKESYFSFDDLLKIQSLKTFQKQGLTIKQIKDRWALTKEFVQLSFQGSDKNDAFLNRFINLSKLFIYNLPQEITVENMSKYTAVTDPLRLKILVTLCQPLKTIKGLCLKILAETSHPNPELFYNNLLATNLDLMLENCFHREEFEDVHKKAAFSTLISASGLTALLFDHIRVLLNLLSNILSSSMDSISVSLAKEAKEQMVKTSGLLISAITELSNVEE